MEFIEQITLYLEMIDFIDNCLQSYKNKYQELKGKKRLIGCKPEDLRPKMLLYVYLSSAGPMPKKCHGMN